MLNPIDPWKLIIHKERIEKTLKGGRISPVTLGLDISNLCNHNCVWCLYDDYKKEHNCNMTKELISKSIKEAKEIGVLGVCLSGGGEPTMNPELNYAILKCKDSDLDVSINTNGSRLDRLSLDALNALSYIRISLDAGSKESHNRLHRPGEGGFHGILDNIEGIKKQSDTAVGVGYLVHPENYEEIAKVAKLLNDLNVEYIQIRPLKNITLAKKQMQAVCSQIDNIRGRLKITVYESFSKMEDTIQKREKCKKCYINRLVANIGPDGYVYICCELRGVKPIGNIRDDHFADIWFSRKHEDMLEKIDVAKCPACKYAKGNEIIEKVFINDELDMNFI